MPLTNIKVLEFVGLAPAPFCGKILSDFGASVLRIDKVLENQIDVLSQGKSTLAVNLKEPAGKLLVHKLVEKYDVLIEPFRPGVMEKLGLGPDILCAINPRLIYTRLTGFGQQGPFAQRAGHDINYVALSGVLSMLGRHNEIPHPPINILADFAGGGLLCALGICMALLERYRSGCGQIIDASMVDGVAYVASWLFLSRSLPIWMNQRGLNILDGGAFYYNTYKTKDGRYMSVGALEPQFFDILKQKLNLPHLSQYAEPENTLQKLEMEKAFLQKTQKEWTEIFENVDACVFPVLEWDELMQHNHHFIRESFQKIDSKYFPQPAPRFSRTPGRLNTKKDLSNGPLSVLVDELNLKMEEIENLIKQKVVYVSEKSKI